MLRLWHDSRRRHPHRCHYGRCRWHHLAGMVVEQLCLLLGQALVPVVCLLQFEVATAGPVIWMLFDGLFCSQDV